MLAGCARTPDLGPWAEQTAEIQSSVAEEHAAIISKFIDISNLSAAWNNKSNKKSVDSLKKNFSTAANKINGTLIVMVIYSNSIAHLAMAGQAGAKAIDDIADSINRAANTVDESLSPVDPSNTVFRTVKVLADAFTTARSQESLAKAMTHAQPAIESIGNELKRAYRQGGAIYAVNSGLSGVEDSILVSNALLNSSDMYQSAIEDCSNVNKTAACDIDKVTKLKAILDSYVSSLNEIESWKLARSTRARAIVNALDAWTNEHKRVANYLERCGGLKLVAFECEGLNVSHLAALINISRSK